VLDIWIIVKPSKYLVRPRTSRTNNVIFWIALHGGTASRCIRVDELLIRVLYLGNYDTNECEIISCIRVIRFCHRMHSQVQCSKVHLKNALIFTTHAPSAMSDIEVNRVSLTVPICLCL